MNNQVRIKSILKFLDNNDYDFEFIGSENDSIYGFSSLFNYKKNTMTFISHLNSFKDYRHNFVDNNIQLILMDPSEEMNSCIKNAIKIKYPKRVFFNILDEFYTSESEYNTTLISNNDEGFKNSYISNDAKIGNNVKIGSGCVIEGNVVIGDNTEIHHNVVIRNNTRIGKNCTIYSGCVIGESGFNPLKNNENKRNLVKHYGGVIIEDDVHIGDNCCIIRGAIDDTVIKEGAKLNTMIHVAHNSVIGKNTVITMPTHICGSVQIGDNCHIAASVIRNQCSVGDGAVLGLGAVVVKDVPAGITVVGNPAKPMK